MSLKILLIEDELPAMEIIEVVLNDNFPDFKLVGKARNVSEAYKFIKSEEIDLIISDIELEDQTIFDVLDHLEKIDFKIIFVTGYDAFALKAFKLCAIDYLMKPLNEIEFVKAVERAKQTISTDLLQIQFEQLKNVIKGKESKKIIFKTSDKIKPVLISDIIQLKASGSYTEVVIKQEGVLVVSGNLKEYETMLLGKSFFRSHQSHLVNLDHFDHFHKGDGGYLVLSDLSSVPLSLKRKSEFFKILETL